MADRAIGRPAYGGNYGWTLIPTSQNRDR